MGEFVMDSDVRHLRGDIDRQSTHHITVRPKNTTKCTLRTIETEVDRWSPLEIGASQGERERGILLAAPGGECCANCFGTGLRAGAGHRQPMAGVGWLRRVEAKKWRRRSCGWWRREITRCDAASRTSATPTTSERRSVEKKLAVVVKMTAAITPHDEVA